MLFLWHRSKGLRCGTLSQSLVSPQLTDSFSCNKVCSPTCLYPVLKACKTTSSATSAGLFLFSFHCLMFVYIISSRLIYLVTGVA